MKTLILPFIHFVALVGFIAYKTKTPFGNFMRNRHHEVVTGLNKSKTQAAEVAQRKVEIEAKVSNMGAEKQKILAEWKEREGQQIKAIQESSQRVLAQIKSDAEINKRSLEQEFRTETLRAFGALVMAKAEQKLKTSMNSDSHKKVNDGFINQLAGA